MYHGDGSFVFLFELICVKIPSRGVTMPREARAKSNTGIYHIILRSINKQNIFEDDEDYQKLLETLKKYQEKSGYEIYAYCLMSNHIHLLMKEIKEELGIAFRRIGASFVYWYNWKYARSGHLFQDRYKSEAVESDRYFLTVLRYIHQNPLKAGIVKNISDYPWSSYSEYIVKAKICNIHFTLGMFSQDEEQAIKLFKEFNLTENKDHCLSYEIKGRLHDIEALDFIKSILQGKSHLEIQNFEKERIRNIIKKCKERGLSLKQIERLTRLSFSMIRRI